LWRSGRPHRHLSQLGSAKKFPQEQPLTPEEAFVSSPFDSFIPAALVHQGTAEKLEGFVSLIIGVDPAGRGAGRTSIAWRRRRKIEKIESRRNLDTSLQTYFVGPGLKTAL